MYEVSISVGVLGIALGSRVVKLRERTKRTSIRTRALARLASARTCFMTVCLTELESMAVMVWCLGFARSRGEGDQQRLNGCN